MVLDTVRLGVWILFDSTQKEQVTEKGNQE